MGQRPSRDGRRGLRRRGGDWPFLTPSRHHDDPIIATTAVGALAQALAMVDEIAVAGDYGFYAGLSGIAQCCIEAGTALRRDDLIARGRAAWLACAELPPLPQRLDVINGSAGLIPALIEAAQRSSATISLRRPSATASTWFVWPLAPIRVGPGILSACPMSLICSASRMASQGSPTHLESFPQRQDGATFLTRLARACVTNAPIFAPPRATGPICAVSFSRDRPAKRHACWRGAMARLASDSPGLPSVSFSRMMCRSSRKPKQRCARQRRCWEHASLGTGNFSLCHGDGGNADLLILAADVLSRPDLRREAENAGTRALDRFEDTRSPWPCGVPGAGKSPNLLLGVAGIGYFLLRLYDFENIRSALLPAAIAKKPAKARRVEAKVRRSAM